MDITFHHSISQKDRIARVILLFIWLSVPIAIFYYQFVVLEKVTIFSLIISIFTYLLSVGYTMKTLRFDVVKIKDGTLTQDSNYVGLFYQTQINLMDVDYVSLNKGVNDTSLIFFGKTVEKINLRGWKQEEIEYFKSFLVRDFNLNFK